VDWGYVSAYEPFVAFMGEPDGESIYLLPDTASGLLAPVGPLSFDPVSQMIVEDEIEDDVVPPGGTEVFRPAERATNDTASKQPAEVLEEKLEVFDELNSRDRKVPWRDRFEVIQNQFPSVVALDWEKVFRSDPTIMGNILNDIIKVEVAPKGRPGKRPALEKEQAREVLSRYKSEDYTLLPFAKAVNRLKETQSVRQFARKVSMSPTYAYNLMMGYRDPSVEDMELVASAYGKNPSYFYEYRVAYVTSLMAERMDYAPESSIIYYERAVQARRDAE
jgi:transcriptional regulator with XRE-family HTH domain